MQLHKNKESQMGMNGGPKDSYVYDRPGLSLGDKENLSNVVVSNLAQKKSEHIVFLLTHGFAARMVLRTDLVRKLIAEGIKITVISPNADEEYFQNECRQEGVELTKDPSNGKTRIANWFRKYRPYFLDNVMGNIALRAKHETFFEKKKIVGHTLAFLNQTLAKVPLFRWMCRKIERLVNRSPEIQQFLERLEPDVLVLPNPFGVLETVYLLHAKEMGIRTVCQMLSWDNITSKGTPLLMPDYFISWGTVMTKEIETIYQFPVEKVFECGVAHFDIYFKKEKITPRNELLKKYNLNPTLPYIFYGMVAPYSCPNEVQILAWLVDQINKERFQRPCSLIIRPHPQTISGIYAKDSDEVRKLYDMVGAKVALDMPPVQSDKLAWDLPKNDMSHLAGLLAGSAMCLNASSTLCLDACLIKVPVIAVGFDGDETLPYSMSPARQGLDYIHMAKLLEFGGIRVARSFRDLEAHINAYLVNASLDQEGRERAARQECGVLDGKATERISAQLINVARDMT